MRLAFSTLRLVTLVAPLALLACSGSDEADDSSSSLPGFEGYCTGTLLADLPYMAPSGPAFWADAEGTAPAGTTILIGRKGPSWQGYFLLPDGTAAQVGTRDRSDLVANEDFRSHCASDLASTEAVVLQTSTLYASDNLEGEACTLPAGLGLSSFHLSSNAVAASLTSDELQSVCGYSTGYTDDLVYAKLVVR